MPKGLTDSALEQILNSIPKETAEGARDYALMVLMMAYGIRGVSAAHLLLDDLDWQHSRIRIRAQKGGKEVVLPLMQAVGEALIQYLQHRLGQSPCRNVFLAIRDSIPCARQWSHFATCSFRSPLASRLQAFLEARYGRGRRGLSSQKILLYLDQFFVSELKPGQPITREVSEHWMENMAHLSPNTRINRLCVLRQFCRYLSYFDS